MEKYVLVPVDTSSHSEDAFEYALENISEPKILLLHVLDSVSAFGYGSDGAFDLEAYQQEERRRRKQAERMLEEYAERATERGVTTETSITVGKPARRILQAAEEHDIDHIVMGSRGRSGVGRVLLGSVAETVTRRSAVPVTIVR